MVWFAKLAYEGVITTDDRTCLVFIYISIYIFHWLGPWSVIESPCKSVYVCLPSRKPTSRCHGGFWSKDLSLILACDDIILKKKVNAWIDPPPFARNGGNAHFWVAHFRVSSRLPLKNWIDPPPLFLCIMRETATSGVLETFSKRMYR